MVDDVRIHKQEVRDRARAHRDALSRALPQAPEQVSQHLMNVIRDTLAVPQTQCIASYMPTGSEIDVSPFHHRMDAAGYALALPVVMGRGYPMAFRRWRPGDPVLAGAIGVMEPLPNTPVVMPTVLLVPLLAFDRQGGRLGYGGGFYDRTLALLRRESTIHAIGVGFSGQEMETIPTTARDARLDWIATENGAFRTTYKGA